MMTRVACRAAAAVCSVAILATAFAQPAVAPQPRLGLPRPATLYSAGPGYAWVHPEVAKDPTDPKQKIVTWSAHVHRLADGKYWLWYKWNRGTGLGMGVAVSDDGVKFSPSPLGGMHQVPMYGEGYRPNALDMVNLPDGVRPADAPHRHRRRHQLAELEGPGRPRARPQRPARRRRPGRSVRRQDRHRLSHVLRPHAERPFARLCRH